MLVIAGRCGSTWLGRMMQDLRQVGVPLEWFNTQGLPELYKKQNARGLADYVHKIGARHPVFGFQINPERLFHLEKLIDFRKTFAGFAMIDLRRRDFVAQAFSFARARKSGQWHNVEGPPPEVSDAEVWHSIGGIIGNEQRIDRWYVQNRLSPMHLVYEDIVADRHAVMTRILHYIARNGSRPNYTPPPERQKRNGPDGLDEPLLAFLDRHAGRIEHIHETRAKIDIARAIPQT